VTAVDKDSTTARLQLLLFQTALKAAKKLVAEKFVALATRPFFNMRSDGLVGALWGHRADSCGPCTVIDGQERAPHQRPSPTHPRAGLQCSCNPARFKHLSCEPSIEAAHKKHLDLDPIAYLHVPDQYSRFIEKQRDSPSRATSDFAEHSPTALLISKQNRTPLIKIQQNQWLRRNYHLAYSGLSLWGSSCAKQFFNVWLFLKHDYQAL
jgi:hypothetical protein